MCPAFVAPVLVPEGSEMLVQFGAKVDGVQKYLIAELLAVRPYVKNIAALPELLDKRTDPAKVLLPLLAPIPSAHALFVATVSIFSNILQLRS
jgi:hypothetical protein